MRTEVKTSTSAGKRDGPIMLGFILYLIKRVTRVVETQS